MCKKVSAVSFATYVLSSNENVLTVEKAFVCISLFDIIRIPLVMFPVVFVYLIEVINKFIACTRCKWKPRTGHCGSSIWVSSSGYIGFAFRCLFRCRHDVYHPFSRLIIIRCFASLSLSFSLSLYILSHHAANIKTHPNL